MCDTLYKKTTDGFIFGKNSDRSPNEPNLTEYHPAGTDPDIEKRVTYICVANVLARRAVTITRPAWMWGAEMGTNDAGVVLGNAAVFTRPQGKKVERLTGMDLLRLALERAGSAREAADVIIGLLHDYGQGGNCGFDKPFYYDNSFLIAGTDGAYILETCGADWILQDVSGQGNISNVLAQDGPFLATSKPGIKSFARKNREPIYTFFAKAKKRSCQAADRLAKPDFSAADMMAALQSHVSDDEPDLFARGSVRSLCMHKSPLGDHTTGSIVHVVRGGQSTTWTTGCSTPCLSLYKPTYFGILVPPVFAKPDESLGYWLDREYLVRAIYAGLIDLTDYRNQLARIQQAFLEGDDRLIAKKSTRTEFKTFQKACADREEAFVESFREAIDRIAENPAGLSPLWIRKTITLGHNVSAPTLKERQEGR
ncbi:MAG: hypothetical protein Q8N15_03520 [Bacillota bacterium]|nr:hypothetical protein [Bacillota bacterium]